MIVVTGPWAIKIRYSGQYHLKLKRRSNLSQVVKVVEDSFKVEAGKEGVYYILQGLAKSFHCMQIYLTNTRLLCDSMV